MHIRYGVFTCILSFFISGSINAIFYNVDCMKSPDGKIVYLLSDEHEASNKENFGKQQRRALVKIMKQHSGLAIAEDLAANSGTLEILNEEDGHVSLGNILVDSKKAKIPIAPNVDYRSLVEPSLEGDNISAQRVMARFQDAVTEIQKCDQGKALNNYYASTVQKILNKHKALISKLSNSTKTLQELTQEFPNRKNRRLFKKTVTEFDDEVIDLRLVHQIYAHRNHNPLFVFAGGNHIQRIIPVLEESLGYKTFDVIGDEPLYCSDGQTIKASSIFSMREFAQRVSNKLAPKTDSAWPASLLTSPTKSAVDRIRESLAYFGNVRKI